MFNTFWQFYDDLCLLHPDLAGLQTPTTALDVTVSNGRGPYCRLSLAPLLETVLLLDRCLYLEEEGLPAIIFPLFHPSLSPRNQVTSTTTQKVYEI